MVPTGHGQVVRGERLVAPVLFLLALALGGVLRVHLALTEDGIFWPDEVYQSLEPAHRLVYGYGLISWEFIEGARNWAFPGLIAALLAACRALSIDEPRQYLTVVRLAMVALAMASVWGVRDLALAAGAGPIPAAVGALAFALAAPAVYLSFRASGEVASTAPILFGLAIAGRPGASRRGLAVGASLLGIAVLFRLQNAFYCAILLAILGSRREWMAVGLATGVLTAWAVVLGAIDLATWGSWFHSAITYLRFNSTNRVADLFGRSPVAYYARNLLHSLGLLAPPLGVLAALSVRRAPALALGTLAVIGVYSLVPHKELRFIFPVIALGASLAAVGLEWLARRAGRTWTSLAVGVLLAGAVGSAITAPGLTFGDLGQYQVERGLVSAYDYGGQANRLLVVAHGRRDLCGLRFDAGPLIWTDGYSALHRHVPLYPTPGPSYSSGFFNYVIAPANTHPGAQVIASDGGLELLRLDRNGCLPDPSFQYTFEADPLKA